MTARPDRVVSSMGQTTPVLSYRRQNLMLSVLGVTGMSGSFMQTSMIPLQGYLPQMFDVPASYTTWVITATLLVAAVITPIAGKLGDMFGKAFVSCVLLGGLILGSVIVLVSHNLTGLIIGRGFQGAGMGILPLAVSILRDFLPRERLPTAVALVSATVGVGGALGIPISALIVSQWEWHFLFLLTAVNGVVCLVLIRLFVPFDRPKAGKPVDYLGALGFAIFLLGLLLALSQGNVWGWLDGKTLACFAVGLLGFLLWLLYELRIDNPIVDIRVLRHPTVMMTNLATVAMGFAFFSANVAFPQLLQSPIASGGFGIGLLPASLLIMPAGLAILVAAPIAGGLQKRWSAKICLGGGAVLLVVAYSLSLLFDLQPWHIVMFNVLIGIGIGLGYASLPSLIMGAVAVTQTASANSVNTLMRLCGTSLSASFTGAIVANADPLHRMVAFHTVFALGLAASLICLGFSLKIPSQN